LERHRHFWTAASISGCIHAALFALVWAAVAEPVTPPVLLLPYGNASSEGLCVDVVALDAGSLWQDEYDRPGGALHQGERQRQPAASPAAAEPPSTIPSPFVSDEVVAVGPTPIEETPTRDSEPASPSKPTEKKATPEVVAKSPGTENGAASAVPESPGVGRAPGAQGSSRLPPGTPSAGGKVGFTTGVSMAEYRKPLYPPEAKLARMEGTVVIWLKVSAEGQVAAAKIQQSSGHSILDNAALRFAYSVKFRPARQGATPVEAEATLPVIFQLTGARY
jgi:TonB family protein